MTSSFQLTERGESNAGAWLETRVANGSGDAACIHADGVTTTYREAAGLVRRWSAAFRARDYPQGSRVLLAMSDGPDYVGALLGAMRCGLLPVLVSPRLAAAELSAVISDSDPRHVIFDQTAASHMKAASEGLPAGTRAVMTDLTCAEFASESEDSQQPTAVSPDDPALLISSSGSTGRPKLVVHAHRSLFAACEPFATEILNITAADTVFSSSKLHHAYGLGNSLCFPLWSGASAVMLGAVATPQASVRLIRSHNVSIFCGVPRLFEAIASLDGLGAADLGSLRLCTSAGERLPAETWRIWKARFGLTIIDLAGSTEMLHGFLASPEAAAVAGSCGRPVRGATVSLTDDDGQLISGAGAGEAYVASASMFLEYWNDPARTDSARGGQMWRSGDRYRRDDNGNYWHLGRVDDLFKVNGLWVVPGRIEDVLRQHPAVLDASVVGVEQGGRVRVKAVLVSSDIREDTIPNLRRHCAERLGIHEQPTEFQFVDSLPRGVTGKVLKYRLRP